MKKLALTYLLNFLVPSLLYQSPSFVPYIITIFLFFLPPPICFFFWKRDKKGGVYVGVMMGKN